MKNIFESQPLPLDKSWCSCSHDGSMGSDSEAFYVVVECTDEKMVDITADVVGEERRSNYAHAQEYFTDATMSLGEAIAARGLDPRAVRVRSVGHSDWSGQTREQWDTETRYPWVPPDVEKIRARLARKLKTVDDCLLLQIAGLAGVNLE